MKHTRSISIHAASRMQQRGIPPLIIEALREYGASQPATGRASFVYFDKRARRRLSRDVGSAVVAALDPLLNAFAVVSEEGLVITCGWRTQRILRDGPPGDWRSTSRHGH